MFSGFLIAISNSLSKSSGVSESGTPIPAFNNGLPLELSSEINLKIG